MPGPRNDVSEVRFALSYDALKMSGTPQRAAIFASDSAMKVACASLSITHGPAISARGAALPSGTAPAITCVGSGIRRCLPQPVVPHLIVAFADGFPRLSSQKADAGARAST